MNRVKLRAASGSHGELERHAGDVWWEWARYWEPRASQAQPRPANTSFRTTGATGSSNLTRT
eukprot:10065381-Alexandrium_andersonii.AAC.1